LSTARLAVFPSYAEAFAIAPLEAMATGCPTIYSERGSGRELIEHNENGLLVDPDNTSELAASISRLILDDKLAEQLGSAGRSLIENRFSDQVLLLENIDFYKRCLGLVDAPASTDTQLTYPRLLEMTSSVSMVES
jgi:glycosyltransferase involved in cell wall biosynthesis